MATLNEIPDELFREYCLLQASEWGQLAKRTQIALAPTPETIEAIRLDSPGTVDDFLARREHIPETTTPE